MSKAVRIVLNPLYTGIGPYPRIVKDKLWISAVKRVVKTEGLDAALQIMLWELRLGLGSPETRIKVTAADYRTMKPVVYHRLPRSPKRLRRK